MRKKRKIYICSDGGDTQLSFLIALPVNSFFYGGVAVVLLVSLNLGATTPTMHAVLIVCILSLISLACLI
jgi:hypothetical protein